ncbi:uroporphyrinogen-III synthase [Salimicrobium halophilum]|uniref:uroporphyrinogen-III synthase n=1 Tax=Salimicrobium halophilum TaxID=86666 RepID=UPI0015A13D4F|nr:uroporphyrinogen-III synthase [Salimicrobium halophilum]
MNSLKDKRIAIAADRRASELGALIENFGGTPVYTAIQGERQLHDNRILEDVRILLERDFEWVVLTTGIGVRALEEAARKEGMYGAFIEKMKTTNIAVRGKKTQARLKEIQLRADVVSEDGTMKGVVQQLEIESGTAFFQAYNVDDEAWRETFEKSFKSVYLSTPYEYKRPSEVVRDKLKRKILNAEVQAVLLTSKNQVRNLFEEEASHAELITSLNNEVKAIATGKVTAQELENFGVRKVLFPENQKMGAMVVETARYFEASNDKGEREHARQTGGGNGATRSDEQSIQ